MKIVRWIGLGGVLIAACSQGIEARSSMKVDGAIYQNTSYPIETRLADLLGRMTLEEKVGQLLCPMGWEMYRKEVHQVMPSDTFIKLMGEQHVGMFWATFRADPWTKKTLETGLNPFLAAQAANELQRYVKKNTRLGIPLFLAEEAPHGHMAIGTTVFPTSIGQAATFNPELIERMGKVIAKEVRLQGAHIGYGPVLDLARDPRWSRVEETYGEDVELTSAMGEAMVKGLGGGKLSDPYSVVSTLKHFAAYGVPLSGQNGNASSIGRRELVEHFLPPFQRAVEAGALSVMTSYNSLDGIPSTMNRELLTDVLCEKWKFKGYTVSDLFSIEGLYQSHYVASTPSRASLLSITAGTNVDLGGEAYRLLPQLVRSGELQQAVVDSAVAKVLRLKFEMGLFENPYVDPAKAQRGVRTFEHLALAREVARQSIVLLENKEDILPLKKKGVRVAVVGPNAENIYNQLGDYTAPQQESQVITILKGIQEKIGEDQVLYAKGCAIRDTSSVDLWKAIEVAEKADVVVAVVGGSSARDFKTSYKATGAAVVDEKSISDMECGEGYDRATLDLLGRQMELLRLLKATGKPLVVVYIQGRPLDMNYASQQADALLTAWYPGEQGGGAIADVLFGDYNPSGRLPISIPRHVGQLPCYYNKKNPKGHQYVEMEATPLYAFGYGKSYSRFEYSGMEVKAMEDDSWRVSVTITNSSSMKGTEVVQLYVRDEVASVVQSVKQLKQWGHITLAPNEQKRISLVLKKRNLSLIDAQMNQVVEPGEFTLQVGPSSDDIRLTQKIVVF